MNRRKYLLIKALYSVIYNISYNLNGGILSLENPSTYTIETSEFTLNNPTRDGFTFLGWTVNNNDNYVFDSKFGSCGDKEYTAHWNMNVAEEDISSNISNLTIDASEDYNGDGNPDNYNISFIGSENYEKINLPINNLVTGQKYILTFTESNNAVGGNIEGYYNAYYGCVISNSKDNQIKNSIKENARSQGSLILEWINGESGGFDIIIGDSINGPRDMSIQFTATNETMYWIWDYCFADDFILFKYWLSDILLTPVAPKINFSGMSIIKGTGADPVFNITSYDDYNLIYTFNFTGDAGCEVLYYTITGLTNGAKYTITFNHTFSGGFINGDNGTYEYGCGITSDITNVKYASKMNNVSSNWISNIWTMNVVSNSTESVTLTFTASSDTVYWVWNMANIEDNRLTIINLSIMNFSVIHSNGGNVIFK